jgi:hypothetical protein
MSFEIISIIFYCTFVFGGFIALFIYGVIILLTHKRRSNFAKIIAVFFIIFVPCFIFMVLLPPFLSGRISVNQTEAIGVLKQLCSAEAIWFQQGPDGNSIKEYWTYDVSCFNRMYRAGGVTKVNFIDKSVAIADANRAADDVFGTNSTIESWLSLSSTPKSGYFFRAMLTDENGKTYNQNEMGITKIKATNSSKFAFSAYPETYGSSGIDIFIINEKGIVYSTDPGSDSESKIVLQWPGPNPELVKGPGGKRWASTE